MSNTSKNSDSSKSSNSSTIHSITVTKAFVNDVMHYRLYINYSKIADFLTLPEVVKAISLAVSMDDLLAIAQQFIKHDKRND